MKDYAEQRAAGNMVCLKCGGFSSTQTCWTCLNVSQALWDHVPEIERLQRVLYEKDAEIERLIAKVEQLETEF